jgi:5-methylcytosine-specific restriction endonuclease McrA
VAFNGRELPGNETLVRTVDEWIGKTDDDKIPDRVRLRIFERHGGICHLSGRTIRPGDKWEIDHIIAIANGGEHRESNMAPVLAVAHREKTKSDRRIKAKIDRQRKRHLGVKKRTGFRGWRRMDGSVVWAKD